MPIIEIPEKNLSLEFPDDMSEKEIERVILTDIYGEQVLSSDERPAVPKSTSPCWKS